MLLHRNRSALFAALLLLAVAALVIISPAQAAFINLTPTTGVNSTGSVPLSQLTSGLVDGITVGDKVFTGFNYSRLGDMPTADDVNVLGFKDPSGNWGVSFHGAFIDLPGGGASDALVRFMVEVNSQFAERGIRISDAHIFLGGVGIGSNKSTFAVDETFLEANNSMSVLKSSFGQGSQKLQDSTFFTPVLRKVNVTKDIFALADADSGQPARATVIDQSFSQTPEPTAIVLALFGLSAGCGYIRRRKK